MGNFWENVAGNIKNILDLWRLSKMCNSIVTAPGGNQRADTHMRIAAGTRTNTYTQWENGN